MLRVTAALDSLIKSLDPEHPTVDAQTRQWLLDARADAVKRAETWALIVTTIDGLTSTLPIGDRPQ
jgi:hypothetical protein